ncbi:MAG: hypothetical protein HXY25_12715 [Alphaproteobacteria bacterium]|nr:hypothetical protein [Alphaproteobacteria bacterium]
MTIPRKKLPEPEELLLDYTERLAYHRAGRLALWVHLSRLQPAPRADARQHLLADLFKTLVASHQGQTYALRSGDLVMVLKDPRHSEVDELVYKARYLFREDPLIIAEDEDGKARFCESFEMATDYERFRDAVRAAAANPVPDGPPPDFSGHLAAHLVDLSEEARADRGREARATPAEGPEAAGVGAHITEHRIVRVHERPQARVETETVLTELALPEAPARDALFKAIDTSSNPALGPYMAERVAEALIGHATPQMRRLPGMAALRLRLDTVLSARFLEFDRSWRAQRSLKGTPLKSPLIILSRLEVRDSGEAFRYARDFLIGAGYPLALCDVALTTLPGIDLGRFGISFVFAEASEADLEALLTHELTDYRDTVQRLGVERVVLDKVSEPRQIRIAQSIGIRIYAGPLVDRLARQGAGADLEPGHAS